MTKIMNQKAIILRSNCNSLAPEHVNKLLTSLSENGKLNRYQHREQMLREVPNVCNNGRSDNIKEQFKSSHKANHFIL